MDVVDEQLLVLRFDHVGADEIVRYVDPLVDCLVLKRTILEYIHFLRAIENFPKTI